MDIVQIKSKLNVVQLNLNFSEDSNGQKTDWMRHWDNDRRISVSIHKDTVAAIKADNPESLGLQHEVREGSKGEYTAYRIVQYNPAEEVL